MNEDELDKLAREEILRETVRASARADEVGPQGWMKCPVPPANKRFLRNTLLSTIPSRAQDDTESTKSKSGETKRAHRGDKEHKPKSDKDERISKRHHCKDERSNSPKSAKLERQISTRTKSDHRDTRKTLNRTEK